MASDTGRSLHATRNPMAEALTHSVDPTDLHASIATTVAESSVPYIRAYATDSHFAEPAPYTDDEQVIVDRVEQAINPQAKACYRNAILALNAIPDSFDGAFRYVEGVFASESVPNLITHAWNELRLNDGWKVVDFTVSGDLVYYGRPYPDEVVMRETSDGTVATDPVALTERDAPDTPRTE